MSRTGPGPRCLECGRKADYAQEVVFSIKMYTLTREGERARLVQDRAPRVPVAYFCTEHAGPYLPQPGREASMSEHEHTETEEYISPKDLAERLQSFTLRQIRWHLLNREQNGLDRYVRTVGRRLYITEQAWNKWISEYAERKD
jgi:hypothetical protein